ncbi:MAG: hypothetical protein ACPG61_10240 [Paracoccaceae bacterium]
MTEFLHTTRSCVTAVIEFHREAHRMEPISTIALMIQYQFMILFELDREAAADYVKNYIDSIVQTDDATIASARAAMNGAFEKLVIAAQMADCDTEGSA